MCLCIPIFLPFPSLFHLHFRFRQTQRERKKKSLLLRHFIIPQFLSPHPSHAVKPLTFIIRMTCFSRLRRAVLAINSEGRSLRQHVDRLTGTHSSVFVVWPIKPFVSGGGRLVLNATTPAASTGLPHPQKGKKRLIQHHIDITENNYQEFTSVTVTSLLFKLDLKNKVMNTKRSWVLVPTETIKYFLMHSVLNIHSWLIIRGIYFFIIMEIKIKLTFSLLRVSRNLLPWSHVLEGKLLCWQSLYVHPLGP